MCYNIAIIKTNFLMLDVKKPSSKMKNNFGEIFKAKRLLYLRHLISSLSYFISTSFLNSPMIRFAINSLFKYSLMKGLFACYFINNSLKFLNTLEEKKKKEELIYQDFQKPLSNKCNY